MKGLAFLVIAALSLALMAQQTTKAEPIAFTHMRLLVGGVWRGSVGGDTKVEFRFKLVDNGQVIQGDGIVGDPKKPMLTMTTKIGIDPISNKVFYLDQHNGTTIYFGHITLEGKKAIFDFTALSGDKGHWRAKEEMKTPDSYESTLYTVGEDGKETLLHPVTMKRTKS